MATGEGAVVAVAGGDETAGAGDTGHLTQRLDGVAHVLEDLVGVDHVEGAVKEGERVDVLNREVGVGHAALDSEPSGEGQLGVARMDALVSAVRPNPAYVLDRLSGVVAINPEAHAGTRKVFADWKTIARGSVAQLRAANAGFLSDPSLMASSQTCPPPVATSHAGGTNMRSPSGGPRRGRPMSVVHLMHDGLILIEGVVAD